MTELLVLPSINRAGTREAHAASVVRVVQQLRSNPDRILTLGEMANIARTSPFHFNRIFRSATGVSPRKFQCSLRMEHAKRLLLTTDMQSLDVCLECGYSSLGTFTRRFTEMVGWPPHRFREIASRIGSIDSLLGDRQRPNSGLDKAWEKDVELPRNQSVEGILSAPVGFDGWVFIAAFESAIPFNPPRACTILSVPGGFRLGPLQAGTFYLMATGIPRAKGSAGFLYDNVLRAISSPVQMIDGRQRGGPLEMTLRGAHVLDVPIMLPLRTLINRLAPSDSADDSGVDEIYEMAAAD